jgi:hypothetical protein
MSWIAAILAVSSTVILALVWADRFCKRYGLYDL